MASESMENKEEFHFFGAKESPLHPHHKAEFKVDGVKYNFIEQYVLHKKAEMFKSKDAAELMKITDPSHLSKFDKKLIVPDAKVWDTKLKEFMKKGYLEKSRQVKALFDVLEDTRGKTLVYASRKDQVLGIGVDSTDPLSRCRSNWKRKNLLGDWLMEVREELPGQLESSVDDTSSKQESANSSPRNKETVDEKESHGSEKFTFFWKTQSPFSQWHPCSFAIDDQWYNSAEQYMMHQKAVTFGDHQTAEKILKSKDPQEQKRLGRKVSDFDDKKWSLVSMNVVKRGNLAKFGQDEKLKGILFETRGTTLVEASPLDKIWGIGLADTDPRSNDRSQWLGKNQLGEVLTEVREELMRLEREKLPSKDGEGSLGTAEKDDAAKLAKRKADDVNSSQERKTMEGGTDAKVAKGPDASAVRKDRDQHKGASERKDRKERPNSSQRKDRKVREEKNSVEMRSDVEVQIPVEKMECSEAGEGNEEAEGMGDPGWEGLTTMEVDVQEDETEKKKRERSKDDRQERKDKERALKKGKTGYSSRDERDKPSAGSKFDDKASTEKFTFFWRADSPFSQHHPANFSIDGIQYNCAEQYMMHQKAVVFNDEKIGYEIMHTESPAKQKSLAKQVEGFNESHWKTLRRDVVKRGNIAKFSQNPRLRRMLLATAGTTMVEASPLDSTWGIALSADDPKAWRRQTWSGGNLLGEILTEVREELMEKFKNIQEDEDVGKNYKDFSQGNKGGRDEQYTIFWRPVSPFHPRYPAGFELDNQFYQTLQQYLLHEKALFFNDSATARAIMENTRPNKLDELGRNIRNYDHHSWSKYCRSYLRLGNFAKFSQNPNVGQQLIDNVQHGELVYAVEEDSLLGVGLKEGDGRLYQRQYWKGKNLLGRALMEVRDMLMKSEQTLPVITEDPDDEVVDDLPNSSQESSEHQFQFFFAKSPLSQWHLCRFKIGNIQYNSAEQYMLHQMALHFRDQLAAEEVLRYRHPRDMQNIDIRNYDQRNWEKVCKEIILKGNRAKFMQDNRLRDDLLKTEDSFLAYASTNDVFLGIGLRDTDPLVYNQQNWPGYNTLGEVLMEIRGELKLQTNNGNNNSNGAWRPDSKEMMPRLRNDQPDERFTFFWIKSPFSQWSKCNLFIDNIKYNCTEQYMMHQKAIFFGDLKMAKDIMMANHPSDQWQLGRQVRGYSDDKWNAVCRDVVKKGNLEKFSQNPRLRQQLFETVGTTLVEASPKDFKWGIGVKQEDPRAGRRETWLGENLLGQILTEVRDELMKQEIDNPQASSSARNIPGPEPGRDRRGSEHNDDSQGRRKDFESNPKGFAHESSYEKPRYDHGGGAAGRPYQQHRGGGQQWSNQHSRSERGDTMGRPPQQYRREGGNERPQHNARSFYGERPHAAEPRPYRDGDRQQPYRDGGDRQQRRPMAFSSNQRRNSREEQFPVQEFKSASSGQHSNRQFAQKTRSTPGGQQSQRHGAHDVHAVPAECSKAAQSDGTAQDLPSGGSNAESKAVVDGAVANENFHIISDSSALSQWHHANFEVDRLKYRSVGQYISHQKALRFNDGNAADEIMKSTSVGRIIKSDKYVDGFDERKWNKIYRDVVKDGNYFKFSQNEDLKQKLLETSGNHLVYADFKDRKLGVGLRSDDRHIKNQKKWRGENVFGSMLMLVRDDLLHGRDSTKRRRESADQSNRNSVPESVEEGERRDVQEQTGDSSSFDKGDLGAANSSCPQNKDRLENDAEVEAVASSAEYEKDNVSERQKPENLQKAASHEKESLQEPAIPERESLQEKENLQEKESLQEPAIPEKESLQEKENLQESAAPDKESLQEKENLQESAAPDKESLQEKENLQESAAPDKESLQEKENLQEPATPEKESLQEKENLQESAAPDKESLQEKENLQAPATPEKVSLNDSAFHEKESLQTSGTSEVQHKVEAAEINSEQAELSSSQVTKDSVQTIDLPQSPRDDTENDKDTTASETSASSEDDEVAMVVPHTEAVQTVAQPDSSSEVEHVAKKDLEETEHDSVLEDSNDTEASDVTSTSETEAASQSQSYDAQKCKDTQTTESQPLVIDKFLATEKDDNTSKHSTEKLSKDSLNGESHQEDTVSTAADRKKLESHVQDITADTCQGTLVEEILIENGDTEETSDSAKEDVADEIVDEIHQECTSTAGKTEAVQVESGILDMAQHASTEVKDTVEAESSTESQPEEAISASITENISHEKTSLKEKVDREGSAEGCQEVEKGTLEVPSENDCQDTSMTPVDRSASDAEINKEKDVLVAESDIKLTVEPITEKPDDKSSNECCKQEENCNTLQEAKSSKEGLGDESKERLGDKSLAEQTPLQTVKEIIEDNTRTEDSCEETKPVTEASDDRNDEKLEDESNVESIPGEASTPVGVKDRHTEASCQETELVKDKLADKTEAELGDESSVESIPDVASVQPTAVKEALVTQTSPEKSKQEITLAKEESVGKVEEALDDESSVKSDQSEANSIVAEKEDVSEPVADVEETCPEISAKVEIDGTNSAEVEASQQATDVFGTKEDHHPALTDDLQTGERNSENGENCDETSQVADGRDKTEPETNPVHQVS